MNGTKTAPVDPIITGLATALAEAEITSEKAAAAHRDADAARDAVRARITDMDARRGEIAARRAAGDQRPDDGAELALISMDREILEDLLARHDATVAATGAEVEQAKSALAQAQHDLAREEALRIAAALDRHLEVLDAQMLAGIRQVNDIACRLGRGLPDWRPTVELLNALVPLDPRWRT